MKDASNKLKVLCDLHRRMILEEALAWNNVRLFKELYNRSQRRAQGLHAQRIRKEKIIAKVTAQVLGKAAITQKGPMNLGTILSGVKAMLTRLN